MYVIQLLTGLCAQSNCSNDSQSCSCESVPKSGSQSRDTEEEHVSLMYLSDTCCVTEVAAIEDLLNG